MAAREITRRRQRGVTLVELLVVLAILAFMAGLVALNAPPARSGAKDEAERFAARLRAAWEEAALDGTVYSVHVLPGEYRIERLSGGQWMPADRGRGFSERDMPKQVSISARSMDPAKANERPQPAGGQPLRIILDPIGMTTPFSVEFVERGAGFIVRNAPDETIMVERRG